MYSGTTFRVKSGRVAGVHQKIDRVARRHLPGDTHFPSIKQILHFEGLNGPDGVKRKSPAKDEPWHYIDPSDKDDVTLREIIAGHSHNLSTALKDGNDTRAAFEAAWLAHAVVDGLTPAHHYPLEEKLEDLRGGEGLETRDSIRRKLLMPGKNRRHQLRNNWLYWGAKGVMTTHLAFELGVASMVVGRRMMDAYPDDKDFERVQEDGFMPVFEEKLKEIADLDLYNEFIKSGWTQRLARDTRDILMPEIIRAVTLAWYACIQEASDVKD